MKVKFTTTLEQDLVKKAKILAVEEGRSVADIIEELIYKYLEKRAV